MSKRTASWLAWSIFAVCVALIALALLLGIIARESFPFRPGERLDPSLAVLTGVLSLAYPTLGALIASRLPTNPIGWIFCGVGLLYSAQRFTEAYADYALLVNRALPAGEYVAWSSSVWGPGLALAGVFVMLLFPDGRLLSRRWRIVAWAALFGAALGTLGDAFMPGNLFPHPYVKNPFGVAEAIGGGITTYDLFAAAGFFGRTLVSMSNLAALFSVVLRLYRARGDEREQLKWFLYAAVPSAFCLSIILLDYMLFLFTTHFLGYTTSLLSLEVHNYVRHAGVFALLLLPICTYIAIVRYHLYEIDVIINRTLVYGSLTGLLALLYFGSVTALQYLFSLLTGQGDTLAIVASTLAIAALFSPLRGRIQGFIDRRFYRRKYDAAKTLEAFGARLREETDLEKISDDLVGVVRETMQPSHISLWLSSFPSSPKRSEISSNSSKQNEPPPH